MGKRLVLNFHGLGEPHHWVDQDERRVWCDVRKFLTILDSIPKVSAEFRIPIEITFDDGNVSDLAIAVPALQTRGLTASFFVCAGRIGKPGYLDASDLADLARAAMTVGSHGWDHVDWRRVRDDDSFEREIFQARDVIAAVLPGHPIESVAIPFGSYDRRVRKAAMQAFARVYTSDGGLASLDDTIVSRESYSTWWETDTVRALAGRRPVLNTLRRSLAMAYKRHRGSPRAEHGRTPPTDA